MSRQCFGVSTGFTTTRVDDPSRPAPYGTEVPKSFEPKSSSGHLASFCYHCNQRIECHGSYWAIGLGTLRTCDPAHIQQANRSKAADNAFRGTLRAQEEENCRPTRTVANMSRNDPQYYPAEEPSAPYHASEARHSVTRVLKPMMTPFGTEDNNYDRAQADARRGKRAVDGNVNNYSNFYGAGAVNTPEPSNRASRYY